MVTHLASKSSPAVFADWSADPASAVLIAETKQVVTPIGYAVLTDCDLPVATVPGDIELRRIYVLAPFHAAGVGARLLEETLVAAVEIGARRVLLGVNAGNARALRFYRRSGFTQIGTRRFQVGAVLHDDLVLAREL